MYTCNFCEKKVGDGLRGWKTRHGTIVCASCYDLYGQTCVHCSNMYMESDYDMDYRTTSQGDGWYCNNCYRDLRRSTSLPERRWTQTTVGTGFGEKVPSARGWSCEIECYLTNTREAAEQIAKLPTTFGIGRDGSLVSVGKQLEDGRVLQAAVEITTPILKGKKGELYLTNLCRAINAKNNAEVDVTCGLHLHIDMSDCNRDNRAIVRLMVFHWLYENVIMSFLASTRRANKYCQSMKNDYHYAKLASAKDMNDLVGLWYKNRGHVNRFDKKHPRYHGINFHNLWNDGHIEVRYHSGTTNPKKIFHWAALHTAIIDFCVGLNGTFPEMEVLIKNATTVIGRSCTVSKLTKQMFEMIKLPEAAKNYFLARQKKFKHAPNSTEVEFIEKDDPSFTAATDTPEIPPARIKRKDIEPTPNAHWGMAAATTPDFQPIRWESRPVRTRAPSVTSSLDRDALDRIYRMTYDGAVMPPMTDRARNNIATRDSFPNVMNISPEDLLSDETPNF